MLFKKILAREVSGTKLQNKYYVPFCANFIYSEAAIRAFLNNESANHLLMSLDLQLFATAESAKSFILNRVIDKIQRGVGSYYWSANRFLSLTHDKRFLESELPDETFWILTINGNHHEIMQMIANLDEKRLSARTICAVSNKGTVIQNVLREELQRKTAADSGTCRWASRQT